MMKMRGRPLGYPFQLITVNLFLQYWTSKIILCNNDRYRGCEPLRLSCPSCSGTFDCPPVSSLITSASSTSVSDSDEAKDAIANFWRRMRCPRCPDNVEDSRISPPVLANQVIIDYWYRMAYSLIDEKLNLVSPMCRWKDRPIISSTCIIKVCWW